MSDYTPTTEQVRQAYAGVHSDAFDRWLAQHDAEIRKQVAEEIAEAIAGVSIWTAQRIAREIGGAS